MHTVLAVAFWSLVVWLTVKWSELPGSLRTYLPRALLIAGLSCFALTPFLDGHYSQEVALYIGGPNRYAVETIHRSFATLFLGIGVLLLAVSSLVQWGDRWRWKSPLDLAFKLTVAVIALRVGLEKLGVPLAAAMFFGIIWLAIPVAVYFGVAAAHARSQRKFWTWLFAYAIGTRAFVITIMLVATYFQLGTHFDVSSVTAFTVFGETHTVSAGSWAQYRDLIFLPQSFLWTSATLLAGLVFGVPSFMIASHRRAG